MINSSLLQTDSDKRLRSSLTRTTKTDLLTIPPTDKLDDINNNHYDEHENNANDCTKADLVLNDNENDATLLTTTTTTTVEVKVKTTKTSSRKRKLNAVNDMNSDNIHKQQQPVTKKKKNLRVTKPDERTSNKKANFQTVDQSSTTDESSFGSCEPGTNVVLQGIVWNETDKGVLVVNITWRGKTYVGALLNTTEQNWAPPRYKSDVRSTKQNHNRDQQLTSLPSSQDSTERILRNGKRRGSSTTTTVTPSSTTKNHSFKIPPTPPPTLKADDASTIIEKFVAPSSINMNDEDETNSINEEKRHRAISNGGGGGGGDDEIGDNYSSRSISPTTSGTSTTSSSPPLLNNTETQSSSGSIPMDLSHSTTVRNVEEKTNDNLLPYHFPNDIVNSSAYFSSLHGSTNAFSLPSFNKLSSQSPTLSSSSSYLSMPPQLYFNALTLPHYPSVSSLSKSSR